MSTWCSSTFLLSKCSKTLIHILILFRPKWTYSLKESPINQPRATEQQFMKKTYATEWRKNIWPNIIGGFFSLGRNYVHLETYPGKLLQGGRGTPREQIERKKKRNKENIANLICIKINRNWRVKKKWEKRKGKLKEGRVNNMAQVGTHWVEMLRDFSRMGKFNSVLTYHCM